MSNTDSEPKAKPAPPLKPRSSTIIVALKVEEAAYQINMSHAGMQLGSVSPVHVYPKDFELYHSLIRFAIDEWKRAKEVEKAANQSPEPPQS